jgi:hypothetical protein
MQEQIRRALWQSATIVNDYQYNPAHWRMDSAGRLIYWFAFRDRTHPNGWDVGHVVALADGGVDEISNWQVEQYETRAEKEQVRAWFKGRRGYDPLLSVYGNANKLQLFVGGAR